MTAAGRSLDDLVGKARKLIKRDPPLTEDEVNSISNEILLAVEEELATGEVTAGTLAAPDVLLQLRALVADGRPV